MPVEDNQLPKKTAYFRTLPNGRKQFLTDDLEDWTDLEHGKTTTTNAAGEQRVWDESVGKFVPVSDYGDYLKMGLAAGYETVARAGERLGLWDENKAQAMMHDNPVSIRYSLPSPEYSEAADKAGEGILPAIGQMVTNPLDFAAPIALQSAPQMVVPLATGIAGAAAGTATMGPGPGTLAGLVGGAGIGSFGVNYPSRYNELQKQLAAEQGISPNDPNYAVWANNPQVKQELNSRAMAYAAPVAAVDSLAALVGGRSGLEMAMAAKAARTAPNVLERAALMGGRSAEAAALAEKSLPMMTAKAAATQSLLGGASEIAGQLNEQGKIYDPTGVAAEALLELPSDMAEVGTSFILGHREARTPIEKRVQSHTNNELAKLEEEKKANPDAKLSDFLTSEDSRNVFEYLNANGYSAQEASTLDEAAFTKLALKLRAAKQVSSVTSNTQLNQNSLEQNAYNEGVRQLTSRGWTPERISKYDPKSITQLGMDTIKQGRKQENIPLLTHEKPLQADEIIEPPTNADLERQLIDAQGLEAQAKEAAHIANIGAAYMKSLGWKYAQIAKMSPGELYQAGLEAKRNPRMDALLSPSRQIASDTPENIATRAQQQEAFKRQGIDVNKSAKPTDKPHFVATVPEQRREKGRFTKKESDVLTRKDLAAVLREEAKLNNKDINPEDVSGLIDPDYLNNPNTYARTEAEQTIDAVRAFRDEVNNSILGLTNKKEPNKFKQAIANVKQRRLDNPKLSANILDFPIGRQTPKSQGIAGEAPVISLDKKIMEARYKKSAAEAETKKQEFFDAKKKHLIGEVDDQLRKVLNRVGLLGKVEPQVVFQLLDNAAGMVSKDTKGRDVITIAALQPEGRDIFSTMNHEVIHALRNLNLITPSEWRMLEKAAKEGKWADKYGLTNNEAYKDLDEAGLLEEAVAEHFAQTRNVKDMALTDNPSLVGRIKQRIQKAFDILRTYINEVLGFDTPADVLDYFERIDSGEIGRRNTPDKAFQRSDSTWFAHVREWINKKVDATHVSPHDFDEFNTDFMGTGEGAQAFGWGLYFGSAEKVAKHYYNAFKRSSVNLYLDGKIFDPSKISFDLQELVHNIEFNTLNEFKNEVIALKKRAEHMKKIALFALNKPDEELLSYYAKTNDQGDFLIGDLEGIKEFYKFDIEYADNEIKLAETLEGLFDRLSVKGKTEPLTYWVNFWNDPINQGHLLNFDLPISEQSQHVRDGIREILKKYPELENELENSLESRFTTGFDFYEALENYVSNEVTSTTWDSTSGRKIKDEFAQFFRPDRAASYLLSQVGNIPGHIYGADGGRDRVNPNFVIYDGSFIEITDKDTFNWQAPIKKLSKNIRDLVKKEEKALTWKQADPSNKSDSSSIHEVAELGQRSIGPIGWWFRGLQDHAARIPALRPLFKVSKDIEQLANNIRVGAINVLVPLLKFKREERIQFNKALAIMDANNKPMPKVRDDRGNLKDSLTVTLDEDNVLLGKKGTSVTLSKDMLEHIENVNQLLTNLRVDHRLSTITPVIDDIMAGTGIDVSQEGLINIHTEENLSGSVISDTLDYLIKEYEGKGAQDIVDKLSEVKKIYTKAFEDTKVFYIPKVRQSPLFFTIYDKSKPIKQRELGDKIKTTVLEDQPYERIATVNIPMGIFGKPSKAAQDQFIQRIFEQVQANNPNAFIPVDQGVLDLSVMKSAESLKLLGNAQFDAFEQLAMISEIPGIDDEQKETLLKEFRKAWSAKGYEVYEKKSQKLPGFIHEDNMDNYIIAAGSVYADRAARSIANNTHRQKLNKALNDIKIKTAKGLLDKSVYDYAEDYRNYINSPANEFSRIRGFMFNWFLGLNPSSAVLNNFQIVHSSLPVLTAMYGSPHVAAKELLRYMGKNTFTNKSMLDWKDVTNPNPYKEITNEMRFRRDVNQEHVDLIEKLVNSGVLRPHTIEEMQARDIAEQLTGASKESVEDFKTFMNKVGNISSYLFGRIEALTRTATAMAAYDMAKKAQKDPKVRERLKKFIESTAFADADILDPVKMAEVAVELSHPDTTKYNRAKAFRGVLSIPTQFMAFPVKMLDLYITLFQRAFGIDFKNGNMMWNMKSVDPNVKAAFTVLFLGLLFTSGLGGAIPFGEPSKEVANKVSELITGINPDFGTEMRESLVDLTGSPVMAEMLDKGMLRYLLGMDVSQRMGVQTVSGVNTTASILDALGPTGAVVGSLQTAYDRYQQGHTTLAVAELMPVAIRNLFKASYMNSYGLVTAKGNITPVGDYNWLDTAYQAVGFTPADVARTREAQRATDNLATRTSVAKERAMDTLTTLRVKSIFSRREGDVASAVEFEKKYRDYIMELSRENRSRKPQDRVTIDAGAITKRVLQQLRAKEGRLMQRPLNPAVKAEAASIDDLYRFEE